MEAERHGAVRARGSPRTKSVERAVKYLVCGHWRLGFVVDVIAASDNEAKASFRPALALTGVGTEIRIVLRALG